MGKGSDDQEVTQRVEIPAFLRPFAEAQAGIGLEALRGLAARLSGAPAARFSGVGAAEPSAPRTVTRRRLGGRGSGEAGVFTVPAPTIEGGVEGEVLPPIPGASAEDLVASFTPDQLRAIELARARAQGAGGFIPTAQQEFLETARGRDLSAFIPQSALSALTSTAEGDFLFGGDAFDRAVDAALRRAQPAILSTFGAAGRGTGGLARTAIAQAATDAFAQQFGQERQRQLAAAGLLGEFGQTERGRQLEAARLLPELAFADTDALLRLGALQQQQRQRELTAPITALESLLAAAGGGIPPSTLLGTSQTGAGGGGSSLAGGLSAGLGGGLAGAQLGSLVPGIGTGLGAGLGAGIGLLGGLFG